MIFPYREGQLVQHLTVSMIQILFYVLLTYVAEMALFNLNWPVLMIFPLQEGPVSQTGDFKQSLDSFYVTDSPLSVTNIAEMALFYLNWPVLMILPF